MMGVADFWASVLDARNKHTTLGCGRCGAHEEMRGPCYWCSTLLCDACWGEVGHCGHAVVDGLSGSEKAALYRRRVRQIARTRQRR